MPSRRPPTFIFWARKPFDEDTYIELYQYDKKFTYIFRDRRTGRFVPRKDIYRYTKICRSIVIHNKYYSAIAQVFGAREVIEKNEDDIEDWLIEFVEEWIDYSKDKWWFPWIIEKEFDVYTPSRREIVEVFHNINVATLRIENEMGATIEEETRDLEI